MDTNKIKRRILLLLGVILGLILLPFWLLGAVYGSVFGSDLNFSNLFHEYVNLPRNFRSEWRRAGRVLR